MPNTPTRSGPTAPPKVRGILFAPVMRRAVRSGAKVQTRRPLTALNSTVNGSIISAKSRFWGELEFADAVPRTTSTLMDFLVLMSEGVEGGLQEAPPDPHLNVPQWGGECWHRVRSRVEVGDLLYVKEPTIQRRGVPRELLGYFDDGARVLGDDEVRVGAIFMPRRFARLWLEVTSVKAEQVASISHEDAIAEGVESRAAFRELWARLHKKSDLQLDSGTWVFCYGFRVLGPEEAPSL